MPAPALLLTIGARDATRGAFNAVSRSVSGLARLTGTTLGVAAGAAAGLTAAVVATARSLDELATRARNAGIPPEVVQSYRLLGDRLGVDVRATSVALQRFNRRVGEVAAGTGQLFRVFQQLDIEVRNSDGSVRSIESVLPEFAAALNELGSEAERARFAMAAFDTEGVGFGLGIASLGSTITDQLDSFRQLGLIIDNEVVAAASSARNSFQLIADVARVSSQRVLGALAPAFGNLAEVIGRTLGPVLEDLTNSLEINDDILVDVGRTILTFARDASAGFLQFAATVAGALASIAESAANVGIIVAGVATALGRTGAAASAAQLAVSLAQMGNAARSAQEFVSGLATTATESLNAVIQRYDEAAAQISGIGQEITRNTEDGAAEAVANIVTNTRSEFARSVAEGIQAGAERGGRGFLDFMRRRILNALYNSLAEGLTRALISAGAGTGRLGGVLTSLFGGGLQDGGRTRPGRFYLVGERGPELFIPNQGGEVVPLTPSGAAGGEVVLNVTNNFTGSVRDDADRIALAQEVETRTVARITDLRQRGRL